MNRNSLRSRVTTFYVGMMAIALLIFSCSVYFGVRAFLMRSLERSLTLNAESIATDYVKPLDSKGVDWFVSEMSESYPPGISDTFVRVTRGDAVLYQTGELRIGPGTSSAPLSSATFYKVRHEKAAAGQQVVLYAMPYRSPAGALAVIETGATTEPVEHILRSLFLILLIGTPVILVIAGFGGYVLMSQPLRPVVTLTEQAERVGRQDLGERLPVIRTGDELERLSLALNRMIERLEETVAHNRRFSADASHELRTPLTIIRGELEALMETPTLPPVLADGIGSALEESNRMSHIVDNLMAISRLDGGGESIVMLPVDLVSLAKVTLDHMSLLAEEKRILLRCEATEPVYVNGDSMRIKQVIANLLDNAIKYTPNGGSITLRVLSKGSVAIVEVCDTGIGIPGDALPFIFDRFYRADQARSRESGGIGLGLSIVKSICVAHHGSVSATSVMARGTTLRVELPLFPAPAADLSEPQLSAPVTQAGL